MSELTQQSCEACRAGTPTVSESEKLTLKKEVPDWEIVEIDGEEQLHKVFKLKNFAQAQAFTNKVADLAEAEDHHPAILLEYGKVTVSWWTHSIGGLHKNDFVMAAKTDAAFNDMP
ncbi:4a-hydroxytetrahydrobiopterin dehydratase [Marinobacter sp. M216]|uniref:Putative pterin-4-alpha-carbinolamine dehydratase n=1 Tax=Marinobacter albus TaxID=3030833 RepID=A0ABT7HHC2_9GAMM|nr:4a-hydroxytetrahydrobiopterin dehydratase [Marinobacter sp. M216]MDK9559757.1 4a-hydroxytetrahydrobiopterin dehydratase [Marinobacter sp. M216]